MGTLQDHAGLWRFGVFEVDAHNGELRRNGVTVKLREQSFRILVYLVEHAGRIVSRDDLRRLLWPADTFVDFDHSLNTAMMKLRDVLGDTAEAPIYIETIPKRGYRFIAPVSTATDPQTGNAGSRGDSVARETIPDNVRAQAASGKIAVRGWRNLQVVVASGLVLLVGIASLVFLWKRNVSSPKRDTDEATTNFQIVPVTTAPGRPISPAFSPDGHEIAFAWDGPERKLYDVYVQLVGSDKPLRLTYSKSGDLGPPAWSTSGINYSNGVLGPPAWSSDGTEIAFVRCGGQSDGVYVVPALGGGERRLTNGGCKFLMPGPIAWISEGKEMLMVDHCSAAQPFGLVRFSLVTGEKRCLTDYGAPNDASCGFWFSLSPDGRTIAYIAPTVAPCLSDIYTIPISGGAPHRLTFEGSVAPYFMWTPDSQSIVFNSGRTTLPSLWRVSANGGPTQRETTYPAIGSFSKGGGRLVYSEQTSAEGPAIWRADLTIAGGPVLNNRDLIHTQYPEANAQPSPDGSQIVWMSWRTGNVKIWKSDSTGESPLQLTHLDGYSGTPRWSPDGRWIAFDYGIKGSSQIYVVDSEGRNLHSITDGPHKNVVPSWSRDGKSIYFASNRTGSWQVWKHSLEGGTEAQLTKLGGFDAFESYDGLTVYFSKFEQAGIWSIPVSGGMESLVVGDKPQSGYWGHWATTKAGLYLLNAGAQPRPRIEFYDFATRRTSPVLTLEKWPLRLQPSLSATADGRTIYYTQYDQQSVLKLMEISH